MIWLSNHKWAALGFLVSVACWPFLLEGAFIPRWAAMAVGLPIVSRLDPRALPMLMRVVLCYLLWACVASLLRTPSVYAGVGDLVFVLILSAAFLAGAALESLDDVMMGLGAGLGLSVALAAMQYFGLRSPLPNGSIMPAGLFYNSEMLGEFAGLIAAWAFVRSAIGGGRTIWLIAGAASVALVLTGSRVGVVALAVGVLAAWRPRWRILAPLLVALAIAGLYALLFTKLSSSVHRITIWGATILALNPVGNGLGWVSVAYPFEEFTHSDALQALAELGLGALALVAIPIKAFASNRGNHAERALFAAVVVETFISFPLHFPATGFVSALVAGFLVGSGHLLRDRPFIGGAAHDPRRFWRAYGSWSNGGRGGWFGLPLSLRPVSQEPQAIGSRTIGEGGLA